MEGRVMIQNDCNWKGMSWDELKQRLTDDPEYKANIELARRVVNNYEVVVNYYLGPMCTKIVERIRLWERIHIRTTTYSYLIQ